MLAVYGVLLAACVFLVITLSDRLRAGEQNLRVANVELDRKSSLRRDYLHMALHDIQAPVGVVTTNLELIPDPAPPMMEMIDFCTICKKCAENCPSRSIPIGEREDTDGVRRWVLNAETCFAYWNEAGTDCGICMKVIRM